MYDAVVTGEVDAITAFPERRSYRRNDLVVLADPRGVLLRYDGIILMFAERADDPLLLRAIAPLIDAIPVETMRQANYLVDRSVNPLSPVAAARWLSENLAARIGQ